MYRSNDIIVLRFYLSDKLAILFSDVFRDNNYRELLINDLFFSRIILLDSVYVVSVSIIFNRDVRNILLRVDFK